MMWLVGYAIVAAAGFAAITYFTTIKPGEESIAAYRLGRERAVIKRRLGIR